MKKNLLLLAFLLLSTLGYLSAQTARLQVIHNCASTDAEQVDVWLNDTPLIDDFKFRSASPFIDAPAGEEFVVSITLPTAMDTMGALFQQAFTLDSGMTYVVVASGTIGSGTYMPATPFSLEVIGMARETSMTAGNVDVMVFHGSTDAPTVDVVESLLGAGTIVDNINYGESQGYLDLGATAYRLDITDETGMTTVAQFDADIITLADQAITILASGFLDPSMNNMGPAFGLYVALPAGGELLKLPAYTPPAPMARLQVIHNCAATDAATVDVWYDDKPLLDDFMFRYASEFVDVPADEEFTVSITLPTAMDTMGALFQQKFTLAPDMTYIVVASGTIGSGTYTPATPFSLEVIPMAREASMTAGNVDVMVYHGSTDAPTVDVVESLVGAGTIVDDISYGESQGYLDLGATAYRLDITDETGMVTVAQFDADVTSLADQAITILASGFLDPSVNNMGDGFGLFVALPTGGPLLALSPFVSRTELVEHNSLSIFPNSFDQTLTLSVELARSLNAQYQIVNLNGKTVKSGSLNIPTGSSSTSLELDAMAPGMYLLGVQGLPQSKLMKFIWN